jgi:hypothetical protein
LYFLSLKAFTLPDNFNPFSLNSEPLRYHPVYIVPSTHNDPEKIRLSILYSYENCLSPSHIKEVSERLGIERERIKVIREREGLERKEIQEAFLDILERVGVKPGAEKLFLSGGLTKIKGIEKVFKRYERNRFGGPELSSAFGASLKYILKDCSPDFRAREVSERELKRYAAALTFSVLILAGSLYGLDALQKGFIKSIREKEKELFSSKFPDLPPVAVRDQVISMAEGTSFPLTERLSRLAQKLEKGIKIFRLEYSEGRLKVEGEAPDKKLIENLNPKKIREISGGAYEFEVELK